MKNICVSALFLLVTFLTSDAQESWDLRKCIDHAFKNNINIQQSNMNVDLSELELNQSRHNRYPSLNASTGANWNFGRTVDPTSNSFNTETFFSNNISLSSGVVLYNGGQIRNTIKRNKLEVEAAKLDAQQMSNDIALQVSNTYLNVLFAQENRQIAKNQLALTLEQLEQLDKLINAGARPSNERLDIEAQAALQEQNIVQTENTYEIALLGLKQLLRLDPNTEMDVVIPSENLVVTLDPDVLTFDEIYQSSLRTQANIASQALKNESSEIAIDIAKASLYPSLTLGGSLGTNYSNRGLRIDGFDQQIVEQQVFINGTESTIGIPQSSAILSDNPYLDQLDENLSYGFGLSLRVPIYNNLVNKTNVERSKLNAISSQLADEQLRNNLKTNVQQALANAKAAKKQFEASEKSVAAQRASYANAQKRFDLGAINTFDFINAKNQLDNAELNLVISKYDYIFKTKVLDFYLGNPLTLN